MIEQQPHETIWTVANAIAASRCLHVVAELGVADHIDAAPVAAEELASRTGADAGALGRALRLLATHGIFEQREAGFAHTAVSELLRSDHPMSMRAFARLNGLPGMAAAFAALDHSIRTGAPALETVEPGGIWAYLEARPAEAEVFAQAMTAKAAADIGAVLQAYDFTRFSTIADIGGGRGHLLRAVLDAVPTAHGVLFDLPPVVAALEQRHDRMIAHGGDFFVDDLPTTELYILMEVLHDWTDDDCVRILSAIRRAASPGATVIVVEAVVPDEEADPRSSTLDVIMLAITGGRERTPREFAELFDRAGFGNTSVIDTPGALRIVEATAR